jgi:hypothetical protein
MALWERGPAARRLPRDRTPVFTVEVSGPGTGIIEVSYMPEGISIGAWSGGDTFAWDKSGKPLSI